MAVHFTRKDPKNDYHLHNIETKINTAYKNLVFTIATFTQLSYVLQILSVAFILFVVLNYYTFCKTLINFLLAAVCTILHTHTPIFNSAKMT